MAWNDGQGEADRLGRMYGEMGDGELLTLYASMSDLTDAAQAALQREMASRRLEAPIEELEPVGEPRRGDGSSAEDGETWKLLHVFSQTFEAQHAFELMERAEIPFVVEDRTVDEKGELRPGPAVQLALLVEPVDWEAAVALLRRKAGLFPEAVVDPRGADHEEGDLEMFPVGHFEDEEELAEAGQMLQEAGIPFEVVKADDAEWTGSSIEVAASDAERAITVLERLSAEDAHTL